MLPRVLFMSSVLEIFYFRRRNFCFKQTNLLSTQATSEPPNHLSDWITIPISE